MTTQAQFGSLVAGFHHGYGTLRPSWFHEGAASWSRYVVAE